MKNAPMRFDGMSLHHNPHQLHVENEHHIRSLTSPCCAPDSLLLSRKPCVISGEGELYGEDCQEQYLALQLEKTMSKDDIIIVCLSGRGDKDVAAIARYRGVELYE